MMPLESIKTPCTGICEIGVGRELCRGCGRSRTEITLWSAYSDEEREDIMLVCQERLFQQYQEVLKND